MHHQQQFSLFWPATKLNPDAFDSMGVHNFSTKVMVFLRRSRHIEMQPYNADEFIPMEELKDRVRKTRAMKQRIRIDLMRETNRIDREELEAFEYRLSKYMYELKAHAVLNRHIEKAEALVSKFRNQKPPENATNQQIKDWERKKLTTGKVLGIIRKYITSQHSVPRKEVALVKTSYGFKLKPYAPRLLDKVTHKAASINDLILGRAELPVPETVTERNRLQIRAAEKLIRRKQKQYEMQNLRFADMEEDVNLKEYLDRSTFINKDGEACEFTALQKHDLNLVLQKRYALLNWQQGSGKTAAVYYRARFLLKFRKVRNAIILAPAIATNMTWIPFLSVNRERFRVIRAESDLTNVPEGMFLVVSTSMLGKLRRGLVRYVKQTSRKLCLVFDESDEITNPTSQRTRNILCIFRRLKYKILDTGTTTRNNIAELYSQFELLYNNSVNMVCWSPQVYHENKEREIEEENNTDYGTPFPASGGTSSSVPATVPEKPPYSALRSRTRMSITRRNCRNLSARRSSHASSGISQEKNTRYRPIPSVRRMESVRFTVSSSRNSAVSVSCITTVRVMRRRMPDSGSCGRSNCSSRPVLFHT